MHIQKKRHNVLDGINNVLIISTIKDMAGDFPSPPQYPNALRTKAIQVLTKFMTLMVYVWYISEVTVGIELNRRIWLPL